MVTGASTADLAVLLVDARKGVLTQTRRHSYLASLVGIRSFVLAVNKMDLVDYDQGAFDAICADYRNFADKIGIENWAPIPVSGLNGDNVMTRSEAMPWYSGASLLEHLDTVPLDADADSGKAFRLPVQWVNRPNQNFRGFSGQVASGTIGRGAQVRVLPSGRVTHIDRIVTMPVLGGAEGDGELEQATAGQSVTVTFADEVDCSRGDVIAAAGDPPEASDQFEATIVWMADEELLPGRGYWLKIGTQTVTAMVQPPKYEINVNTLERLAAPTLGLNAIGVAELATDRDIVFEPYAVEGSSPNKALGGFILIDKLTNATVACGMLHFALRRAANVHRQHFDVGRETHAALKGQRPAVLWFTGLSGAGKSTIANLVEKKLVARGRHTFLLDGDNVRHGLNRDLGFTETDRIENIRRVGEVGRLMTDAGLIVLTAFISPFRAERHMVRRMIPEGEFFEIFVDTPLAEAEKRDVKGLYAKARAGELKNFTGIDSPYEAPEAPEIHIDTTKLSSEEAADLIVEELLKRR
jgi:bifunctional enzyme CysN/CysC